MFYVSIILVAFFVIPFAPKSKKLIFCVISSPRKLLISIKTNLINNTLLKMKKLFITLLIFCATAVSAFACSITFELQDSKGKTVKPSKVKVGEEYVLVVQFETTHGNCGIAVENTKFKLDGIKVEKASDWVDIGNEVYTRKLKIKIVDNNKDTASIVVVRECGRGGALESFVLKK